MRNGRAAVGADTDPTFDGVEVPVTSEAGSKTVRCVSGVVKRCITACPMPEDRGLSGMRQP